MSQTFRIEGMDELKRAMDRITKLPMKVVSPAARKGANIVLRDSRQNAPVDTGDLKRGIVLKGERSRLPGKKVFQVSFSKTMSDVFVKTSKAGKRAYYPASQEFGYKLRNGEYMPGLRYMRNAADANARQVEQVIVKELTTRLEKEWLKGQ